MTFACTIRFPAARGLAALPGFARNKTQVLRPTTPEEGGFAGFAKKGPRTGKFCACGEGREPPVWDEARQAAQGVPGDESSRCVVGAGAEGVAGVLGAEALGGAEAGAADGAEGGIDGAADVFGAPEERGRGVGGGGDVVDGNAAAFGVGEDGEAWLAESGPFNPLPLPPFPLRTRGSASLPLKSPPGGSRFRATCGGKPPGSCGKTQPAPVRVTFRLHGCRQGERNERHGQYPFFWNEISPDAAKEADVVMCLACTQTGKEPEP